MNGLLLLAQSETDGGMKMSAVNIGLAVFLLLLNFAISWFNAWSVGRAWNDAKVIGGFTRFVVWCGAIMSACGFTWVYTIVLALLAGWSEILPAEYVQGAIELGYLLVIVPIIGSGLGITFHSYGAFMRRRSLTNGGIAAWNTYAQIHNVVNAVRSVPPVLDHLGKLFSAKGDGKGKAALLMVLLVVLAAIGGVLTTVAIVNSTARRYSESVYRSMRRSRPEEALA